MAAVAASAVADNVAAVTAVADHVAALTVAVVAWTWQILNA